MERSTIDETRTDDRPVDDRPSRPLSRREARRRIPRHARRRVPRSRGAMSGLLLVLLGIWAGLVPFVGPYFNYEFASDQTWLITWDRFWLCVLPAALVFFGGLLVLGSRNRASGGFGAWLALAGGIWFAVGPAVSMLWDSSLGPAAPIGGPIGSNGVRMLEYIGFFYGVGALATALAAFALGRFSVVGVRDLEYAGESPVAGQATGAYPADRPATTRGTADAPAAERTAAAPASTASREEPPPRSRFGRIFGRR